jgi:hypothetical protein
MYVPSHDPAVFDRFPDGLVAAASRGGQAGLFTFEQADGRFVSRTP